jgi:hypothetical protein
MLYTITRAMNVFLSYAAADEVFAREVASRLAGDGLSVWHDDKLLPGDNWAQEAGKALEDSDAMVVLLSPEWAKSPRLLKDVEYALGKRQYAGRLIGVVIRPTEQVPWILEHLHLLLYRDDPQTAAREVAQFLSRKREVARG